jgi:hypothetical protein
MVGFRVKLNSFSLAVHLYCVSYIVSEEEKEQVTFDDVTKLLIISRYHLLHIKNYPKQQFPKHLLQVGHH